MTLITSSVVRVALQAQAPKNKPSAEPVLLSGCQKVGLGGDGLAVVLLVAVVVLSLMGKLPLTPSAQWICAGVALGLVGLDLVTLLGITLKYQKEMRAYSSSSLPPDNKELEELQEQINQLQQQRLANPLLQDQHENLAQKKELEILKKQIDSLQIEHALALQKANSNHIENLNRLQEKERELNQTVHTLNQEKAVLKDNLRQKITCLERALNASDQSLRLIEKLKEEKTSLLEKLNQVIENNRLLNKQLQELQALGANQNNHPSNPPPVIPPLTCVPSAPPPPTAEFMKPKVYKLNSPKISRSREGPIDSPPSLKNPDFTKALEEAVAARSHKHKPIEDDSYRKQRREKQALEAMQLKISRSINVIHITNVMYFEVRATLLLSTPIQLTMAVEMLKRQFNEITTKPLRISTEEEENDIQQLREACEKFYKDFESVIQDHSYTLFPVTPTSQEFRCRKTESRRESVRSVMTIHIGTRKVCLYTFNQQAAKTDPHLEPLVKKLMELKNECIHLITAPMRPQEDDLLDLNGLARDVDLFKYNFNSLLEAYVDLLFPKPSEPKD